MDDCRYIRGLFSPCVYLTHHNVSSVTHSVEATVSSLLINISSDDSGQDKPTAV